MTVGLTREQRVEIQALIGKQGERAALALARLERPEDFARHPPRWWSSALGLFEGRVCR